MRFLYMGFIQQANVRRYRFQGAVPKERPTKLTKNIEFLLTADMSVLPQYQIRIQDVPALCLQILATASTGAGPEAVPFASYAITHEDFSAYASARNAIEQAKATRRKPRRSFKPSASSQLRWPQVK